MKNKPPICKHCHIEMRLIKGKKRKFWGCPNYPKCKHTLSLNLGIPMGIPHEDAGVGAKSLRRKVHSLLNEIWDYNNQEDRKKMYLWLKKNTMYGHVSMMKEEELKKVISLLKIMINLSK